MKLDYADLLFTFYPGFFEQEAIRTINPEKVYAEQILDLSSFRRESLPLTCPSQITFGMYSGDWNVLLAAVEAVQPKWLSFFKPGEQVYCALDGDNIASFCLLRHFGTYQHLLIGGPGCVGTVPSYRKQGIGLKMIQNVTALLKEQGYNASYIHYTGVGHWYAKLGYETVLRWNNQGILEQA